MLDQPEMTRWKRPGAKVDTDKAVARKLESRKNLGRLAVQGPSTHCAVMRAANGFLGLLYSRSHAHGFAFLSL